MDELIDRSVGLEDFFSPGWFLEKGKMALVSSAMQHYFHTAHARRSTYGDGNCM